ncbi:MAG TPA: HlyD family efflux transporter periplasmic adaptor subunit [Rhizomicrobium sp.]|jgi:membrane fusion protein (multidrug efflux system)|nr:HlyD family efflux transporter periplasmic adaptor subunit [Rhizomicrobium sp.]
MANAATVLEHPAFERAEAPARMPLKETARAKGNNKLRMRLLIGLGGLIAASALAYGGYSYLVASRYVTTDNAYVGADVAQINSQVSGPIAQVAVSDTKMVHKGDVLVTIDPADAELKLGSAEADYRHTLQRVSQYYSQRLAAAATVAARQSDVSRTAEDYARRQVLSESGAISREQLSTARTAAEAATANLAAAREQLDAQEELIKGFTVANHPETLAAKAAVEKAKLDLTRTVIRAPIDGVVAQRKAQVGQSVQPGQSLMTVSPIGQAYVDANFKEGQLGKVQVGQPVTLTSDLYGSHVVYHGRVAGMGGGTGSAFAVIPAQNATGNWIKVVQRVPVRIALDAKELAARPLRVGLSMNASIDTQAE